MKFLNYRLLLTRSKCPFQGYAQEVRMEAVIKVSLNAYSGQAACTNPYTFSKQLDP